MATTTKSVSTRKNKCGVPARERGRKHKAWDGASAESQDRVTQNQSSPRSGRQLIFAEQLISIRSLMKAAARNRGLGDKPRATWGSALKRPTPGSILAPAFAG